MMIVTQGLPGLDLDGRTSLRGPVGLAGLGESNRESHPELAATAKAKLIAQGYKADCTQAIVPVAGGTAYYGRQCSISGSPYAFSADSIAKFTQQYEWDGLADELRSMGLTPITTPMKQTSTTPPASSTTGGRDRSTSGGSGSIRDAINKAPASTQTSTPPANTNKPQEKPPTEQPGEVPAKTDSGIADKLAGGAADDNKTEDSGDGFFSASFKIGDVEIPIVLVIAAVGMAFVMSNKGGK